MSLEHCCAGHNSASVSQCEVSHSSWYLRLLLLYSSNSLADSHITTKNPSIYISTDNHHLYTLLVLLAHTTVLANLYVYSAPIALASDFISQSESAGMRQHPLSHHHLNPSFIVCPHLPQPESIHH